MSYNENRSPDIPPESSVGAAKDVLLRPGVDQVFDSLCCRRRRLILLLLKRGRIQHRADLLIRGDDGREDLEAALTHSHLPKLADAGYIEWDQDTGEVSRGPRFEEIEPLLELIQNHADELPPGWP